MKISGATEQERISGIVSFWDALVEDEAQQGCSEERMLVERLIPTGAGFLLRVNLRR